MKIPDHFIPEFSSGWDHKVQQKKARILEYATVGPSVNGEAFSFNQIDETDPREVTGQRLVKTVAEELETDRRWMYPRTFQKPVHWDRKDPIFLANQDMNVPNVVTAISAGFERMIDKTLIEGAYGVNQTGKTGNTPAMVDQIVDIKTGGGTQDAPLNRQKLIVGKEMLTEAEALNEDSIAAGDRPILLYSPNMLSSLLMDDKLTSIEYANLKSLESGTIDTFLGFKFVMSTRLPVDDNGNRVAIMYMKSGLHFRHWDNRLIETGKNPDRSFAPFVFVEESFGACRSEEKKFVFAPCANMSL